MKRIVIDANVVVKWFLDDEEYVDNAVAIKDAFLEDKIDLIAPIILPVEWANAMNVSIKRKRFPDKEWEGALEDFEEFSIPIVNSNGLLKLAWSYSRSFDKAVYDGIYMALASIEGCELVTGDKPLFNSVQDRIPWVRWIGDFAI